jgi:hypothetical protein
LCVSRLKEPTTRFNRRVEPVAIVPEPEPEERAAILAALAEPEPRRVREWGRPELGEDDDRPL